MKRIPPDIKIIGTGLALLYGVSLLVFLGWVNIPEYHTRLAVYAILFLALFIASIAVVLLQEWGRRLIVVLNGIMFFALLAPYIPKMHFIPIGYFLMNFIVFFYFSQSKVKSQFHATPKGSWKSILIVDDDEIHIKTVRHILISNGYSVLSAPSGEYGLQIAKTQKPDLVILDVILPGIKGRDVCKRLKADKVTEHIPVIFLTSKDSPDDIKAEMEVGAVKHLTKPVNPKLLISTLQQILK